jgi:pimeloyl-ACP methyl ester carboxylesterase
MKKLIVRGVLVLLGAVLLLAASGLVWRAVRQHRVAEAMAIPAAQGIDERGFVRIGGVDQWIMIRGQNRGNPAILMLHGGPGAASSALEQLFLPWERDFTIVQWDQRGAGKSFRSGEAPASIDLMVRDALEVSEYVRHRLQKDKIILLGHSWGSVVGVHVLKARPDMFHAWVGTGQIMNMQKNEVVAYARVLAKARARGDKDAIDALEKSGAPPYHHIQQMGLERRWAMQYESGLEFRFPTGPQKLLAALFTAPDYSLKDVVDYIRGVIAADAFVGETMDGPVMQVDLPALGTDFPLPFFVVQGAEDDITPATLAQEYFDRITAPRKSMELVPGAGHMALMTQPDTFLKFLLANVRPLALQP